MKSLAFYAALLLCIFLCSCGQECVTCTKVDDMDIVICDDPDINYTDFNGMEISYQEAIDLQRSVGYECR